jgi:hypothetical protein
MKTRQVASSLAGIAALVIAFVLGLYLRTPTPPALNRTDKLVRISASPSPETGCEVDYPVASLRAGINHIQWASSDKNYWISFKDLRENPDGYVAENPLVPDQDPMIVPAGRLSGKFNVKYDTNRPENYYMYAIYDQDPKTNPNNLPCKKASLEHDTGVIVKR